MLLALCKSTEEASPATCIISHPKLLSVYDFCGNHQEIKFRTTLIIHRVLAFCGSMIISICINNVHKTKEQ